VNAYLCTYRHKRPKRKELEDTKKEAKRDPLLRELLDGYHDGYYDWGDDPSFFSAQRRLCDVRKASWGVCRPDVRGALAKGDVVVFFCGREEEHVWRYYFVGFGTVRETVAPRSRLWTCTKYEKYRDFWNVLVGPDGGHREMIHRFHDDWEPRAARPYVIFDERCSSFNLTSPHCVGMWDGRTIPEEWFSDDRSKRIERLLFAERGIDRRLRTSAKGYGHVRLNLLREGRTARPGRSLRDLLKALRPFVES
jgi:hypothetical protein